MGYHVLPSIRDYWSTEPDLGVLYISNVMSLKRFEEIVSNCLAVDSKHEVEQKVQDSREKKKNTLSSCDSSLQQIHGGSGHHEPKKSNLLI